MTDRLHPFISKILERFPLNGESSTRETWHISLDISGSNITYQPGDSVGILPENDPKTVDIVLRALKSSPHEKIVTAKQEEFELGEFLLKKANLTHVTKKLAQKICEAQGNKEKKENLSTLLQEGNEETLQHYLQTFSVPEFLEENSDALLNATTATLLQPLLPRFYSVASSQKAYPNELHLVVQHLHYNNNGKIRKGVCSHFLCDLIPINKQCVPIYLQPASHFHLPENDSIPIIMIGPGTGIAPFRGFMQERVSSRAKGKNWLFFGERHKKTDFFYENYWTDLEKSSNLILDTAFSRDQSEKIYVQHRLWEKRDMIWSWLQEGSIIYVCGDAQRMAKDVDHCLVQIFQEKENISEKDARGRLKILREQKRYLRDIY